MRPRRRSVGCSGGVDVREGRIVLVFLMTRLCGNQEETTIGTAQGKADRAALDGPFVAPGRQPGALSLPRERLSLRELLLQCAND